MKNKALFTADPLRAAIGGRAARNAAGKGPVKSRRAKLCALLALLLAALSFQPALAVTVLKPDDSQKTAYAERLSEAKKRIRNQKIGSYGMVPVYARDIQDGAYDVGVQSTSPFFKITEAQLIVDGDEMRAEITIGSKSYLYVYMGTAQAAEQADRGGWIEGRENRRSTVFSIPVPALNMGFDCAAFSKNRQRWYERQLLIDASALPQGALAFDLPDYAIAERAIKAYEIDGETFLDDEETSGVSHFIPEPMALRRTDGEYSIEVNMAGGSGRASVSSPTLLIVREGRAYARLLWSSPYYDYMVIGDEIFDNLTTDGGNSTFEIPITVMDEAMDVIADTTAMGDPIEIEYTLTFYSESIGDKSQIPQEAAKKVLLISASIIVIGAVLNHFVKKKRK